MLRSKRDDEYLATDLANELGDPAKAVDAAVRLLRIYRTYGMILVVARAFAYAYGNDCDSKLEKLLKDRDVSQGRKRSNPGLPGKHFRDFMAFFLDGVTRMERQWLHDDLDDSLDQRWRDALTDTSLRELVHEHLMRYGNALK